MTKIALVVSDCDGTLVTPDKVLTEAAIAAVQRLQAAGIGFTLVSSRPPFGMRMFAVPLQLKLPFGAYNGSSIVDLNGDAVVQALIPADAGRRALQVLHEYEVDAWVFTGDAWAVRKPDGVYVGHEAKTIATAPAVAGDLTSWLDRACKIVGASDDFDALARCEAAMQAALGDTAHAVRSQRYYLDVTPPGHDKGTFVNAIARWQGIAPQAVATIGDMANDVAMFRASGVSVAMGNATDAIKAQASFVTRANTADGFASAIGEILKRNAGA